MNTAIILSAISMGFLGSFHCIGMCGPLALSLPVQHLKGWRKAPGILLYNLGRVSTYALMGLILGLISKQFSFFGWQQKISVGLGILFVLYLLFSVIPLRNKLQVRLPWQPKVMQALGRLYQNRRTGTIYLIGVLNGLLPCGMVYMALAAAFATGSHWNGAMFMAIFGLGTVPAMASISFLGNMISLSFRNKIRKAAPYIIGCMGLLLILRGLNLGIPYLSPELKQQKMSCCGPH